MRLYMLIILLMLTDLKNKHSRTAPAIATLW